MRALTSCYVNAPTFILGIYIVTNILFEEDSFTLDVFFMRWLTSICVMLLCYLVLIRQIVKENTGQLSEQTLYEEYTTMWCSSIDEHNVQWGW